MKTSVMTGLKMVALAMLAGVTVFAQQVPPSAPAKVMPGYIIGPTDVLRVTVYSGGNSQEDFARNTYTVQTDGSVQLPLVSKKIVVGGKSVEEANEIIRKALLDEKVYEDVNTRVDITIADFKSSTIKVQGAVRSGGSITLKADRMNISDALNGAGGLQPSAARRFASSAPATASCRRARARRLGDLLEGDLNQGRLMDVALCG
jgi:protein involved in polysaccharide export with SLBB domain